jgi:hypothetical protein
VSRPQPLLGTLRPEWRIPTILLLIRKCRGAIASLEQLHVLNWAIRDADSRETFLAFRAGEIEPDQAIVRYEPALNRAIDLALGLRLLTWTDAKRLALTKAGLALLARVDEDAEVLHTEKSFLDELGAPITQTSVGNLLKRR